jgi:hypothetical protein
MTKEEAITLLCENFSEGLVRTIVDAIAKDEREECAKICEDMSNTEANMNKTWRNGCKSSADAIRAKGQE